MESGAFPGGRGNILALGDIPPKPETSPYRSRFYVNELRSADGNTYHIGDPIPFEEAVRQGVIDPGMPVPARSRCVRCRGGKWFTNPRPKGHTLGCGCRFCQPCPRCGGSGREPEEVG